MTVPKRTLITMVFGACLGLFVVVELMAGFFSSDELGLTAAWAACRDKGWKEGDLSLSKFKVTRTLLVKTANVTFEAKDRNDPKSIHVTLRKPLNLMAWGVVDYKEEP